MPKKYEALRDEFIHQGTSAKKAKTKAARIYNAQRKPGEAPVTGHRNFGDTVTRKRN